MPNNQKLEEDLFSVDRGPVGTPPASSLATPRRDLFRTLDKFRQGGVTTMNPRQQPKSARELFAKKSDAFARTADPSFFRGVRAQQGAPGARQRIGQEEARREKDLQAALGRRRKAGELAESMKHQIELETAPVRARFAAEAEEKEKGRKFKATAADRKGKNLLALEKLKGENKSSAELAKGNVPGTKQWEARENSITDREILTAKARNDKPALAAAVKRKTSLAESVFKADMAAIAGQPRKNRSKLARIAKERLQASMAEIDVFEKENAIDVASTRVDTAAPVAPTATAEAPVSPVVESPASAQANGAQPVPGAPSSPLDTNNDQTVSKEERQTAIDVSTKILARFDAITDEAAKAKAQQDPRFLWARAVEAEIKKEVTAQAKRALGTVNG